MTHQQSDLPELQSTVEALQAQRDQAKRDYDTLHAIEQDCHKAWQQADERAKAARDKWASLDRACGEACRALNVEAVMWQ